MVHIKQNKWNFFPLVELEICYYYGISWYLSHFVEHEKVHGKEKVLSNGAYEFAFLKVHHRNKEGAKKRASLKHESNKRVEILLQ